jgi:hypothetical protein
MTIDPTSLSRLGPRSHTWTSTLRTAQSVMSEFDPKDKREWLGSMGLQDKRTTQKLTHDWSQPSRGQCGGKLGRDVGGQVGWSNTPLPPLQNWQSHKDEIPVIFYLMVNPSFTTSSPFILIFWMYKNLGSSGRLEARENVLLLILLPVFDNELFIVLLYVPYSL